MKIVCDACQAKYSISDDKVQGKVFKIRCKKCSNIIVVRGGATAAEPAAAPTVEKETRVYDYGYEGGDQAPAGDDAVWHVVINQDQVGPMTAAEVQQKFAAGEIDGETYIWREGFNDWLPMAQVDTFAEYVASGSTTAAVSGGGGASAVAAMFGGAGLGGDETGTVKSDPGDLFAAASGTSRGSDDDGDLFGSKPGTGGGAAASAGGGANSKLRGERNENSVLFSLGNLAQLASDRPAPSSSSSASSSSASSSAPAGAATGTSGGEGSGLIDIRSMATAYRGPGGSAKPATATAGVGSIDDLPVFSAGGFAEPAVIMPTARPQRDNKMMYILIGTVGLLAVAAVILVIVLVKGDKKEPSANQVAMSDKDKDDKDDKDKDEQPDSKGSDAETPSTKGSADPNAGKTTEPVADPNAGKTTEPADPKTPTTPTAKDPKPTARDPKPPRGGNTSTSAATKPPSTQTTGTTAPVAKPPADGGCDEVSCVLSNYEGACCAKFRKGGAKPSGGNTASSGGGGDLPDALDRSMISEGVGKVKARVLQCGDKSSAKGDVKVSVKVNADGSVKSVSVTASPDAALGSCVQGAMQRASFKKTKTGGSFSYPFKF